MYLTKKLTKVFLILLTTQFINGCSSTFYSSRDISPEEVSRIPADDQDCLNIVSGIVNSSQALMAKGDLPELTQLSPEIKTFANGKKYTQYTANTNVMNKYPEYNDFLKDTVEVIFEPTDPFGHIQLRIGEEIYSFNNVEWTSINKFAPRMKKSHIDDMPSSSGYVFKVGKEKIEEMKKDIQAFYKSSQSHNIPPFDAYSPLLKIVETKTPFGSQLKYLTDSPKFGNNNKLDGTIQLINGRYFIDAQNGVKLPLVKKGEDFYLQSYSCSSSAGYVLSKFFGIDIAYTGSAKSIQQVLKNGNLENNLSPIAVINYYE